MFGLGAQRRKKEAARLGFDRGGGGCAPSSHRSDELCAPYPRLLWSERSERQVRPQYKLTTPRTTVVPSILWRCAWLPVHSIRAAGCKHPSALPSRPTSGCPCPYVRRIISPSSTVRPWALDFSCVSVLSSYLFAFADTRISHPRSMPSYGLNRPDVLRLCRRPYRRHALESEHTQSPGESPPPSFSVII